MHQRTLRIGPELNTALLKHGTHAGDVIAALLRAIEAKHGTISAVLPPAPRPGDEANWPRAIREAAANDMTDTYLRFDASDDAIRALQRCIYDNSYAFPLRCLLQSLMRAPGGFGAWLPDEVPARKAGRPRVYLEPAVSCTFAVSEEHLDTLYAINDRNRAQALRMAIAAYRTRDKSLPIHSSEARTRGYVSLSVKLPISVRDYLDDGDVFPMRSTSRAVRLVLDAYRTDHPEIVTND